MIIHPNASSRLRLDLLRKLFEAVDVHGRLQEAPQPRAALDLAHQRRRLLQKICENISCIVGMERSSLCTAVQVRLGMTIGRCLYVMQA